MWFNGVIFHGLSLVTIYLGQVSEQVLQYKCTLSLYTDPPGLLLGSHWLKFLNARRPYSKREEKLSKNLPVYTLIAGSV